MPHDRPGDQLRKERDEGEELQQPIHMPVAPPQVEQVADLLKGKERDAQRQNDAQRRRGHELRQNEIRVFAHAQHTKVHRHADTQPALPARSCPHPHNQPVGQCQANQRWHEPPIPAAVEQQRRHDQHPFPRPLRPCRVKRQQGGRQEAEHEQLRMKQHPVSARTARPPAIARSPRRRRAGLSPANAAAPNCRQSHPRSIRRRSAPLPAIVRPATGRKPARRPN